MTTAARSGETDEHQHNRIPGNEGTEARQPRRKPTAKKVKAAKKARHTKKPVSKPKADRANKKAEVIALMKRAKGATLAEIVAATG